MRLTCKTGSRKNPRRKTKFTFSVVEHLAEVEILAAEILHVVFLERSLDHLPRVVLTGQLTGSRQIRQNTTSPNINVTTTYTVKFYLDG